MILLLNINYDWNQIVTGRQSEVVNDNQYSIEDEILIILSADEIKN